MNRNSEADEARLEDDNAEHGLSTQPGESGLDPAATQEPAAAQKPALTPRNLRKLKRAELLEIMLAQSEEIDRLRAKLAEKDRQLQERTIAIEQSGSIAEAALKLTHVFEEAQKAADLYLDNVKRCSNAASADSDHMTTTALEATAVATATAGLAKGTAPAAAAESPSSAGVPGNGEVQAQEPPVERAGSDAMRAALKKTEVSPAEAPEATETLKRSAKLASEPNVDKPNADEPSANRVPAQADESAFNQQPADQVNTEHPSRHHEEAAFTYTLPTSITASHDGQAQEPDEAEKVNEYTPGDGLKAIEELIDDLKLSGAKHRG